MKQVFIIIVLTFSFNTFAKSLVCTYTNHDNQTGSVKATIDVSSKSVNLEFDHTTITSSNCLINLSSDEITAECDSEGNGVGVMLEMIDGKFEGLIISEKAQIFAQANC